MMPFDLRSELKSKLCAKGGGFNLKKSSTNVDIFNKRKVAEKSDKSERCVKTGESSSELLKSLREKQEKNLEENRQENLSFKEKLKLIEKSSQLLPPSPV